MMALTVEPDNVLALLNKGLASHYLAQYDEAISCYDKVLQIKPNNVTALYNKASSLIKQKKINDGLQFLDKVIRLDYSYKAKAMFDIDFQELKTNTLFKKIIL